MTLKYCFSMCCLIVFGNLAAAGQQQSHRYDLWDSSGGKKIDWVDMDIGQKSFALDKCRDEIEYSLENVGKGFNEINMRRVGSDKGYKHIVPVVTYGLVAVKYQDDCYHFPNAARYFYKDWQEYKKNELGKKSLWFEGPGDYDPLAFAIGQWKEAGMYGDALKHYDEYFDSIFLLRPEKATHEEKIRFLKKQLESDAELKKEYADFMREWGQTKKLAKTAKPRPLEPAVQNHEWFYSGKQDEVLKALEYYNQNKVQFMLEKALKHKDPLVAAKAKEYLESFKKGEVSETGNK